MFDEKKKAFEDVMSDVTIYTQSEVNFPTDGEVNEISGY